jgi:multidrug efflux system outer membrane protein
MKIKLISLGLLPALLFTGCTMIPEYLRPVAPISAQWPKGGADQEKLSGTDVPLAVDLPWRDFFTDAPLRQAIETALQNNRGLRTAMHRVEESRALFGIQRADQLPNISAGAMGSRSRVPGDLSMSGHSLISSQYQATVNLSTWELDFWGRVRSLKDAALESYLASEEARRAVQISLVSQVANVYLLERELDERLDIARKTLAIREESCRIMRRRFEVGSAAKLEATQSEVLLNQARSELTELERRREQSHNALTILSGIPLASESRPLSKVETAFVRNIAPGLPSELLLNRPDVLSAEHRLKAANANIGAARAAFFPRIALTGDLGSASRDLEEVFGSGSMAWSFLPSLSLPIFEGGRNRANLDLAEARRNVAVSDYEQTIQGAFREVADALADRRWIARQVAVQQATVATQTELTRLADLRYQSGAAPYLEVLDAERERFAAEQSLVQTRRALLASMVNLYAALGGGAVLRED